MLRELLVNFPGVDDVKLNAANNTATVQFLTSDQAKLALSGK